MKPLQETWWVWRLTGRRRTHASPPKSRTVCGLQVYADRGHVVIKGLDNEARDVEIVLDLAELAQMVEMLVIARAEAESYKPSWESDVVAEEF